MELELGLGLGSSCTTKEAVELRGENSRFAKKRRFEEAFDQKTTLPLFIDGSCEGSSNGEVADSRRKDDCKELVGWPPFKCSWTKGGSCDDDGEQASYVKVTMEGVLIGRKVDLALHNSYQDLFNTLHQMFPCSRSHPDGKASSSSNHHHNMHMVTYEDGDGDWMLIGDLPWEVFVKSVKRIKIVGSSKQEETARNY